MTLQGLSSSYYTTGLYGSSNSSSAASALSQLALSSTDSGTSTTSSVSQKRMPPPPPNQADMEAAKQKLEEIDPDLAAKMEKFNEQMDELKESGASRETIAETMKQNMDSLSDTEKSELDSVFGARGSGRPDGPGAPPDMMGDLISQLKTTDSSLAEKLQGFEDSIQQLKDDGASDDEIMQAIKTNMDSLTDTEKSEIETAMQTLMENRRTQESDNSSGGNSINLALLQSQVNSTYLQAQTAQYASAFAFAA